MGFRQLVGMLRWLRAMELSFWKQIFRAISLVVCTTSRVICVLWTHTMLMVAGQGLHIMVTQDQSPAQIFPRLRVKLALFVPMNRFAFSLSVVALFAPMKRFAFS